MSPQHADRLQLALAFIIIFLPRFDSVREPRKIIHLARALRPGCLLCPFVAVAFLVFFGGPLLSGGLARYFPIDPAKVSKAYQVGWPFIGPGCNRAYNVIQRV